MMQVWLLAVEIWLGLDTKLLILCGKRFLFRRFVKPRRELIYSSSSTSKQLMRVLDCFITYALLSRFSFNKIYVPRGAVVYEVRCIVAPAAYKPIAVAARWLLHFGTNYT